MPDILIHCPVTGESVSTGLDTETVVFDSLPSIELPLRCSACGQRHYWKPADAWVRGEPRSPRAGEAAELGFKAHPHMLRHACGFALANKGHDTRALQAYLGHKNIQHTVRYTELSPERFRDFWKD